MQESIEFLKNHHDQLDTFTKAVAKVHGNHHPEVIEVRKIYQQIDQKLNDGINDLDAEFDSLRKVTSNYEIPDDACEAFSTVYQVLHQADILRNKK